MTARERVREESKEAQKGVGMRLYTARPGSPGVVRFIREHGIGYVVTSDHFRRVPADIPWVFDNGAYSAWRGGRPFDSVAFTKALLRIGREHPPDFGVLPDIVAGARTSWRGRGPRWSSPWGGSSR